MRSFLLPAVLFLLSAPACANASVTITEVAWMGSAASANHEWIELFNGEGAAVTVDGWTLSDGANLLITLSGTIGAGEYAVLERTSDDTVSGAAFLIYTGALVNGGATLTLRRGDGQIEDRVEGGTNWQLIGGDNTTKYTAQYNGASWQTALPTPGAGTGGATVPSPTTPTTPTTTTGGTTTTNPPSGSSQASVVLASKSRSATIPIKKPEGPLQLAITSQDVMYVHQPVTFTALGTGLGKTILASLEYRWNLGDLTMATGSKVTHRFDHPGTYIIVLQARFGKHDVVVRKEVTVLPINVSLAKNEHGQVLLQNNSVYDVDVSGYQVETAGAITTFPPLSFLAAKQAVIMPLHVVAGPVVLKDPQRRHIASLGDEVSSAVAARTSTRVAEVALASVSEEVVPVVMTAPPVSVSFPWSPTATTDAVSVATMTDETVSQPIVSPATLTATIAEAGSTDIRWPYGVAALVVVGMLAVVWWPRPVVSLDNGSG